MPVERLYNVPSSQEAKTPFNARTNIEQARNRRRREDRLDGVQRGATNGILAAGDEEGRERSSDRIIEKIKVSRRARARLQPLARLVNTSVHSTARHAHRQCEPWVLTPKPSPTQTQHPSENFRRRAAVTHEDVSELALILPGSVRSPSPIRTSGTPFRRAAQGFARSGGATSSPPPGTSALSYGRSQVETLLTDHLGESGFSEPTFNQRVFLDAA
ncbi:uncharacterized protein PHACADRAFT_203452 [Phanerochaete carnosa HHB-10118-sp]|uniref:Uncharacterized protein n=1 Tax=Phanerochaete carnosa (strain HHB-10118-sp) TaxID=650164 RepID=K5XB70_PHACS|nr:uncharacterized protein PHACADRAFT_203452 [Phanerochaete carnosa HHB-10118-sp]EKM60192.1 hypothetical protein PHACADRAFT_203452 [Phanerochaete carnosa HHB-10118-sp]